MGILIQQLYMKLLKPRKMCISIPWQQAESSACLAAFHAIPSASNICFLRLHLSAISHSVLLQELSSNALRLCLTAAIMPYTMASAFTGCLHIKDLWLPNPPWPTPSPVVSKTSPWVFLAVLVKAYTVTWKNTSWYRMIVTELTQLWPVCMWSLIFQQARLNLPEAAE